mmetsp:Transcript_684/g.1330  ORF Transcript_684/g.1330 Transcript_684/m.1330 type:complete len:126 (-) Transcript_684:310-687(-)
MSHFQGMRLRTETGPKAAGTLPCDSASAAVVANILAAARCTLPMIQQLLLRLSTFLLLLLTASMRYPAAAFEVPSMAGQAEPISPHQYLAKSCTLCPTDGVRWVGGGLPYASPSPPTMRPRLLCH